MTDQPPFITILRYISKLFPGNFIKTFIYLNLIDKPRKLLRLSLNSFYRMDHIYSVLKEFNKTYKGDFSILEFGVADGNAFTKKLYATKYLNLEHRIIVHGFDTFEGMPATDDKRDQDLIANNGWLEGQFKGEYKTLDSYCKERYENHKLHKGFFSETLNNKFLESLKTNLPILIWLDADYYTSTKSVFDSLIPYIPNGCVIYFDEPEFNFGSRFTGEARVIHEINSGKFGEGVELVLDTMLSLNSKRVYRFINSNAKSSYERKEPEHILIPNMVKHRTNDSPFP